MFIEYKEVKSGFRLCDTKAKKSMYQQVWVFCWSPRGPTSLTRWSCVIEKKRVLVADCMLSKRRRKRVSVFKSGRAEVRLYQVG
jgi:hypothetical protein